MSDEAKKCSQIECALAWLKVVDNWNVGGFQNKFPRMYYAVAALLLAFLLL